MSVNVPPEVSVVAFDDRYAGAFAALNYAWISEDYDVEPHDRELLDDPSGHIINRGGEILFALIEGSVVGTVALINAGELGFEVAKMAVTPEHQGKGVGRALISKCIEYTKSRGKTELVLESNTRQEAAVHLYRSFGFEEMPLDPNSPYTRVNIRMRLALS